MSAKKWEERTVEKGRHRSVFTAPHVHGLHTALTEKEVPREKKMASQLKNHASDQPSNCLAVCHVGFRFRGHHVTSHPYLDLGQRRRRLAPSPLLVLDRQRRAALAAFKEPAGRTNSSSGLARHRGRSKALVGPGPAASSCIAENKRSSREEWSGAPSLH